MVASRGRKRKPTDIGSGLSAPDQGGRKGACFPRYTFSGLLDGAKPSMIGSGWESVWAYPTEGQRGNSFQQPVSGVNGAFVKRHQPLTYSMAPHPGAFMFLPGAYLMGYPNGIVQHPFYRNTIVQAPTTEALRRQDQQQRRMTSQRCASHRSMTQRDPMAEKGYNNSSTSTETCAEGALSHQNSGIWNRPTSNLVTPSEVTFKCGASIKAGSQTNGAVRATACSNLSRVESNDTPDSKRQTNDTDNPMDLFENRRHERLLSEDSLSDRYSACGTAIRKESVHIFTSAHSNRPRAVEQKATHGEYTSDSKNNKDLHEFPNIEKISSVDGEQPSTNVTDFVMDHSCAPSESISGVTTQIREPPAVVSVPMGTKSFPYGQPIYSGAWALSSTSEQTSAPYASPEKPNTAHPPISHTGYIYYPYYALPTNAVTLRPGVQMPTPSHALDHAAFASCAVPTASRDPLASPPDHLQSSEAKTVPHLAHPVYPDKPPATVVSQPCSEKEVLRRACVARYLKKRRERSTAAPHQIRYVVRKRLADSRPRIHGRFVKPSTDMVAASENE